MCYILTKTSQFKHYIHLTAEELENYDTVYGICYHHTPIVTEKERKLISKPMLFYCHKKDP